MALLLDTQTFLWSLGGDQKLPRRGRTAIADADEVFVSAASAWEIATKHRFGKYPVPARS